MTGEHRIGRLAEIPLGEGRAFEVAGTRVAVFRPRAGGLYATQAECPHKRGPLADGLLGGTVVVCPLHERAFDLATGAGLSGDCGLAVYPVRVVEDGAILLGLPDAAPAS